MDPRRGFAYPSAVGPQIGRRSRAECNVGSSFSSSGRQSLRSGGIFCFRKLADVPRTARTSEADSREKACPL